MKTTTRYFASIIILLMAIYGTAFAQTPDTEPPSQPEGLQVIETHNTAIGISWDVSTDNVGVTGYKIFVDDLEHGTSVDNEYIVTGLSINTSYSIQVLSFDAALNEGVRSTDINPTTSTSTITGTVTSSEGPVPGASVTLTGLVVNMSAIANTDGEYRFDYLRPGIYEVSVGSMTYIEYATEGHTTIQDFMPDDGRPIVHTAPVDNIIDINAGGGGVAYGSGITDKGVVWSTTPYISALSEDTISLGPGEGTFSGSIYGLDPNTVYYIKAFAINGQGIGWGEEYRFYTGCNTIILNEQITNTSCGGTDGAISISHLGLEGPFTYNWTGPEAFSSTSKDISGLGTGTYEVTVMERDGCETVKSYEITEPPPPTINNLTEVICSDGSFTITPADVADGIVPAGTTYSWGLPEVTGGLTGGVVGVEQTSISGTLSNPTNTAQTATYTVTPVSGTCTGATFEVTVIVNPSPAISDLSVTICGGSAFTLTPVNGTDGRIPVATTYTWGPPIVTGGLTGGAAAAGQPSISGTLSNPTNTAQTATYTVTPFTGSCVGVTFNIVVTVNPSPAIIVSNLTHISCYDCNDGAIDITVTSGVPINSLSWTGPGDFLSTNEDLSNLGPGLYTVVVTDQGLCTGELQVEVGNPLVVTKTSDYNTNYEEEQVIGTLRYAMEYANDNSGLDSISFNFVGEGPFTIYPTTNLPWISESLIIDGYSQSGASPASETTAATLMVELNGGSISGGDFQHGLVIIEDGSTIRGLVINGFDQTGIIIEGSDGNVIEGNYIGTNINGITPIPNADYGILIIGGSDNLVGGTDPASRNIISGNGLNGISIVNPHEGDDAISNRIEGNYIGLAFNGMNAIPNQASGIYITGAENIIGGEVQGAGNVISGNGEHGIYIHSRSAIGNQILGNIIGLDYTGSAHINNGEGNAASGIFLSDCLETIVGGTTSNTRNIISGNQRGVYIYGIDFDTPYESRHRIIGNYIGTDITGEQSLGNRAEGIYVNSERQNAIGGSASGEGNLISGNGGSGIAMAVVNQDSIKGNFIGTDVTGTKGIPNNLAGINLEACGSIHVGGSDIGEGNLISANNGDGIVIRESEYGTTSGIYVKGNFIGTDISGTKALGNYSNESETYYRGNGVSIHGTVTYSWIGGTEPNEGNLIAFNENCGVEINHVLLYDQPMFGSGSQVRILSNSIHSNGSIGINLYDEVVDIVTENDEEDADEGPNGLQNYPTLDTVYFSQNEINIFGILGSVPDEDFLLQFFVSPKVDQTEDREGKTLIGSEMVSTNPVSGFTHFHFSFPSSLRDGLVVTATATDDAGNTSEFSNALGSAQDQESNMPMHWVINEEGLPYVNDNSDFQALTQAMDTWEAITTSEVDFEYDGTTPQAKAVANDGINLITFMDETYFTTNEVLGLAAKTLFMDDASGIAEIVDADIVFNPYFTQGDAGFSTDTHTGIYDLQSIATHEIGHTFGMIHSGVLESTMFFTVMDHSTESRTLEQDDIAWASYRYPVLSEFDQVFGNIRGNILYGDDPQFPPVGGALVIATNISNGDAIHAYSDENGDYIIPVPAGSYKVSIEPLDGNVHGYYLTKANISYYIDAITVYTDFPKEYYNYSSEGWKNDDPDEYVAVGVDAGSSTININLVTNKDLTPPEVVAVTPKRDSVGVSVMTQVFMGFSEQVDINTFTDETCSLTWIEVEATGEVYGNFVVADNYGRRIAFTPREYPLDYSRIYTLQITGGVTDLKGNGLLVPQIPYTFTTEDPDLEAPNVTDMIPDYGIDTIFTNANIMVFFSEAMDAISTPDGFSLTYNGGQMVQGIYSWDQDLKILTFDPDSFLDEGTGYTVSVTSGLKDLSGNPLEKDSVLIFSTVPEANPEIIFVGPWPDQSSVSLDSPLLIDFSEPIDPQTINTNTVKLLLEGSQVAGKFEFLFDNSRVIFRPDQLLSPTTTYDVEVTIDISDVSDEPLTLLQGISDHQFTTADIVKVPFIDDLQPSSGVVGTMVTISGEGIDPNPDNMKVMFGDKEAAVIYSESTYLTTRVPVGATEGMVTIKKGDKLSNEEYFYVVPINDDPGDEIRRVVGTQAQAEDVEIEPDAAYAYITNSGANSITKLNMITFQVESLEVGQMPVQIDIHPNGDIAYVSNHLSHDVSVIDLDEMVVVETIAVGVNPYGLVVSPNGDLLYVANTTSEDIIYIDVDPNSGGYDKVVRSVRTNASNTGIDVSPDAGLVLIACEQGILYLITDQDDPAFNTINRTVNTSASASGVKIMPDAGLAVAFTEDNYLVVIGIIPGVNYGHIVGKVNTRGSIGDIDISPDGQIIYVTHPLIDEVSVYEIEYTGAPNADASVNVSVNLELINVIEVDEAPYAIAVDSRAEKVLVGHYTDDGKVTEIYITGAVEVISSLEDLIESVIEAIADNDIYSKYGGKLLVDLEKTLARYSTDQLESAIDHLDNFIIRVERWMESGSIPEDLGYAWLDAAFRIRAQLVKDAEEIWGLKGSSGSSGLDISSSPNQQNILSNKELIGARELKLQNQPNPFSNQTRINFEIPEIDRANIPVIMRVFNTSGQVVKTLIHMDMESGSYSVIWNGGLDDGGLVPDGIYLLELTIPGQREVMTISVIR
ncbi:MAG: Ig-like domain-containing protein [Bacteroidales bacterium]|nr:Ig-like domain-containing protein [Bacteroidales bacterium]